MTIFVVTNTVLDDSSDEGLLDDFEKELENTLASRKRRGERMKNLPAEPVSLCSTYSTHRIGK